MKPALKYCAVYTRKSTEEGLEQDFNSLDAQREACLSYIASQKAEGWVPVMDAYDDGGYIFDLTTDQLKKLVQGFVWRDEHFQGLTIRQIAEREGLSDSHVGKQIFATFELGQMAA